MIASVSFVELQLKDGKSLAMLGSGEVADVLARPVSQPYVRISMRDPAIVETRIRYGTADLTEGGIDFSSWDAFQRRGASGRLFAWSSVALRSIADNSELILALLHTHSPLWLEFRHGVLAPTTEHLARSILSTIPAVDDEPLIVEVGVPLILFGEMLSLIRMEARSQGM